MRASHGLPEILTEISLERLIRIDAGLEGDWSPTVVTVWSSDDGLVGFEAVADRHPVFKPSLELYFDGAWIGVHCFRRVGDENVFDEELARDVIGYVEEVRAR
jgi:hypothetical protein